MTSQARLFDIAVLLGCLALLGMFGWQAKHGARGYAHHESLVRQLEATEKSLASELQRRKNLEARVTLMRPESLDPDLASQLVRETLGYVEVNSIVVKFD